MGQGQESQTGSGYKTLQRDRDDASAVNRGPEVAKAMRAPQGSHIIFTCLMYFRERQLPRLVLTGIKCPMSMHRCPAVSTAGQALNINGVRGMRKSMSGWSTGHEEEHVRMGYRA